MIAAVDANDMAAWRERLAEVLHDLADYHMPFGKYGPQAFPPRGVPLYDLPPEYLVWFKNKGFPKGKLGRLLEAVYDLRAAGADAVLDPLRKKAGGRHPLRPPKRKVYELDRDELPLEEERSDEPPST